MGLGGGPGQPADEVGRPMGPPALAAVAFLCEIWMIVVLAIAGWSLGNGSLMSIALAVFYPALAILIWSVWLAPRSARRLADPWRLVGALALFAGAATLASVAGHVILGVVFGVVAYASFIAARFSDKGGQEAR